MDKKSIESKKFRSPIGVKSDKRLKESALNMPSVQAIKPNAPAAMYRLVFSDSTTQATPGSNNEMAELKAAMLNKTKNNFPKIKPKGIFIAIFVGWVMKRENVLEELELNEGWVLKVWYFLLKFLSPVLVGVVFVAAVFFGVT